MRVLGVDFGFARIGIATGESEFLITSSRNSIAATQSLKKDAALIVDIAKTEKCDLVVVGVPIMSEAKDGGRMQRICQQLAQHISEIGFPVELMNESFSTQEAEQGLRQLGLSNRKVQKRKDSRSAEIILERYFSSKEGENDDA